MNYLHAYHAGNHADVFKHITLIQLIQHFLKKNQAFCYLDTHTGLPFYNLGVKEAQKTQEFKTGIAKLWEQKDNKWPLEIREYLTLIKKINASMSSSSLSYYLGSSGFAEQLLRPQDKAILCDIHPDIHQQLKLHFKKNKLFHTHELDGFQALKAFLPPKEKRGLIFIDPPYENITDWEKITQMLKPTLHRWQQGTYVIWFPIKNSHQINRFLKRFQNSLSNVLVSEFCPWPCDFSQAMNGSGLLMINPPWQFEVTLQRILPILLTCLKQHPLAYTKTYWLSPPV